MKNTKLESIDAKKRQVHFFAMYMPEDPKVYTMELRLGQHDSQFEKVDDLVSMEMRNPGAVVPKKDTLKLMEGSVAITETREKGKFKNYVKKKGENVSVDSYFIRNIHKGRLGTCKYYEAGGREILPYNNIFVFDLKMIKTMKYRIYTKPLGASINNKLMENLCFMLLLLETKKADVLEDFVIQFKEYLASGANDYAYEQDEKKQLDTFYDVLNSYLEKRFRTDIEESFQNLKLLTCIFGLLPNVNKLFLGSSTILVKIPAIIIKLHSFVDEILRMKSSDPVKRTFLDGLVLLFIIEEHKMKGSSWVEVISVIARKNKELAKLIVGEFGERAKQVEAIIRSELLLDVQKQTGVEVEADGSNLDTASSLLDFFLLSKLMVSSNLKKLDEIDLDSFGKKNDMHSILNESLPSSLSKDQRETFDMVAIVIVEKLTKFLTKYAAENGNLDLEKAAKLSYELTTSPEYIGDLFACNGIIQIFYRRVLEKAFWQGYIPFEKIYDILIRYAHHFLLSQVAKPKYLLELAKISLPISKDIIPEHSNQFFELFITDPGLDLKEFGSLLQWWLWGNNSKDLLLSKLDHYYSLFSRDDEYVEEKRDLVIRSAIDKLKKYELSDKINLIYQNINNKKAIELFKARYIREYKLDNQQHLIRSSIDNPLKLLQELFEKYNDNLLIAELMEYAHGNMPILSEKQVLESLFKKPDQESVLYMYFVDPAYKDTEIRAKCFRTCFSIVDKLINHTIESEWLLCIDRLGPDANKIMRKQFKMISEESSKVNKTKKEIDILGIIETYKRTYLEKLGEINVIRDFVNAFCSDAKDYKDLTDELKKFKNQIEGDELFSPKLPERIAALNPYAQKLIKFVDSVSFKTFNQSIAKEKPGMNCLEEANHLSTSIERFRQVLDDLFTDNRTAIQIDAYFVHVKDVKKELDILSTLELRSIKDLHEFLVCRDHMRDTIRLCNSLKLCLNTLQLSCDFDKVIDSGANLSLYQPIKNFLDINQLIAQHLSEKVNSIRSILIEFDGSEDLLKFAMSRSNKSEIDFMKEAVNDYDEGHISTQTIFDFTNFWSFIWEIKTKMGDNTLDAFLNQVRETIKKDAYNNIAENIKTCKLNFYGIQNLYLELTHKEEAKRKQIFKIVERSSIKFVLEDKKFNVQVKCVKTNVNSTDVSFKLMDISELRDRAHLIVYTKKSKQGNKEDSSYKGDELEKFQAFVLLTDVINQLVNALNTLSFNGYPNITELKVLDKESNVVDMEFKCTRGRFDALLNFKTDLDEILQNWNNSIIGSYIDCYELTYLKGRDFWKVESALREPKDKENYRGVELLKYIGKEIYQTELNPDDTPKERLEKLGQALQSLPYKVKQHISAEKEKSLYAVETSEKAIIKGLLTLYLTLENRVPTSSQILICNQSTTLIELTAFAYRCYRSPNNQLFCLIQPENLSFTLQDQFSTIFRNILKEYGHKKYYLGFVTTKLQNHIITSLRTKESTKIFKAGELIQTDDLTRIIQGLKMTKFCKSVTSNTTGLGKTTSIINYAKEFGLTYTKIPISGDINLAEFGKRLSDVLSRQDVQHCLSFGIGCIEEKDKSLLNEILFSLVVLRSLHFGKDVIEVPEHAYIVFEIESSYFDNIREEIEILNYLPCENIREMNFKKLDYHLPEIQFVCHYLNGIADQSLGRRDILEDDNSHQLLDREQCLNALIPKFLNGRNKDYATYTQLNIYVNMLYYLFKSFSESGFFSYGILAQEENQHEINAVFMKTEDIVRMRLGLVEGLIIAADQFTSKSVEGVRNCQNQSMTKQKEEAKQDANVLLNEAIVSWEQTRPFTVTFTADNFPIFVYKSVNDIPEAVKQSYEHQIQALIASGQDKDDVKNVLRDYSRYTQEQLFIELASLTTKLNNRNICPKCFKKYFTTTLKCEGCNVGVIERLHFNDSRDFILRIAQESAKDYALTPDNFIKMLLIFMRSRQKVPIIIMGETGCGKTSLIRVLCTRVLDDVLEVFSIHAGVTNNIIIETMNTWIMDAEILRAEDKKLWVFFDEFNTTASIGLIKEIMCERTLQGKLLPDNMIFLGACNPRRLKTRQSIFDEDVGIRNNKVSQLNQNYGLLYTVHPLPETMIEFVWDYGHLDANTERKYIEVMFIELHLNEALKEMTLNLVCTAQQQFRRFEDASSVSLRDVVRYKIILKWFIKSFRVRRTLKEPRLKNSSQDLDKPNAVILAILFCYLLRISSKDKRAQFLEQLKPQFTRLATTTEEVKKLLYNEEMSFLERMRPLPKGIAENHALRENIFTMIICFMTKTPLFICGKPGCSKSLAVQLVLTNLRGKNSQDEYFRTLPELIPVSFQGSEYCTSESIVGVFNRAEKYLNVHSKNEEILPVIVFDEIGLAEISVNNPLKVLHNRLEIENVRVGFVGVSNWRLDASKMNRALYLARPDPDKEDLVYTAKAIYDSINKNNDAQETLLEALAKMYCDLREQQKTKKKEDIFGLRDFYFLVKGISFDLNRPEEEREDEVVLDRNEKLYDIVRRNIKRNFSGLGNEYEFLWKRFCLYLGLNESQLRVKDPSVKELINDNLKDRNGRYLMLITESDSISEHFENVIRNMEKETNPDLSGDVTPSGDFDGFDFEKFYEAYQKQIKTLVGSQMNDDLTNQDYGYRVLGNVILYVEKGYTIIFKKMDHIYSSLYDLFNQSFSFSGDKKYCRIALGALYNPKCLVHNDFHCVIFLSEQEVRKADPPFLNRFEKYRLRMEDILTEGEKQLQQQLIEWVQSITTWKGNAELISPEFVFVNYSEEYLFSLIIKAKEIEKERNEDGRNDEAVLEYCKNQLIKTASYDFAVLVSLNVRNEEIREQLINTYYEMKAETFGEYCENLLRTQDTTKNIIYTYDQISNDIKCLERLPVKQLKIGNFKSEMEIIDEYNRFLESDNLMFILRIDLSSDNQHLLLVKHLLVNNLNNNKLRKSTHILLIAHTQRYNAGQNTISTLFQDWESVMFDSLEEEYLIRQDILERPSFENLARSDLISSLNLQLMDIIDKCLSKIKYNTLRGEEKLINARRNNILAMFKDHRDLLDRIEDKVKELMKKPDLSMSNTNRDWRVAIVQEEMIRADAVNPIEAMNLAMTKHYENYVMNVIYKIEKDCILDSYFTAVKEGNKMLIRLWNENFQEMTISAGQRLNEKVVEVDFIFDLCFPFSTYEQAVISKIQDEVDEMEKEENRFLYGTTCFSNLYEKSHFGQDLYESAYEDTDLFKKLFNDQLLLYIRKNKLTISVKEADSILDYICLGNSKKKLDFFLADTKELKTILEVMETLSLLPAGNKVLIKAMEGFYDMDNEKNQKDKIKEGPNGVLIYKNGVYYVLNDVQEDIKDIDFEEIEPEGDQMPFVRFLFAGIISQLVTHDYLSQFKTTKEVKQAFQLIEQKILRSKIVPNNIEAFRPWNDVLYFLEACYNRPDREFVNLINWISQSKEDDIFLSFKSVNEMIKHLKSSGNFVKKITKTEIARKFIKLQTQFYKNLTSLDNEEFFIEVLTAMDNEPNLWKSSSKVVDLLDNYTQFTEIVETFDGNLEALAESQDAESPNLERLRNIMSKVSNNTALVLSNKAFVELEKVWYYNYKAILDENFETFKTCLIHFQEYSKYRQQDKLGPNQAEALVIIVWLKLYLYFYSIALERDDKDVEAMKDIDRALCGMGPGMETLNLYVLKNIKIRSNRSIKQLKQAYSERTVLWIKNFMKEIPNLNVGDYILPAPAHCVKDYKEIEELMIEVYNLDKRALQRLLTIMEEGKKNDAKLLCIYSWFVNYYAQNLQETFRPNKDFEKLLKDHRDQIQASLGQPGTQLIFMMLDNFNPDSFFRLSTKLNKEDVNQKMIVLSILITFLAQQFTDSAISSIIFEKGEFKENLVELLNRRCLFGQIHVDPVVTMMKNVLANLNQSAPYIYRCSEECDYYFSFEDCGYTNSVSKCLFCGKQVGGLGHNLLVRPQGPQQLQIPVEEAKKNMIEYIQRFEQEVEQRGYVAVSAEKSEKEETKTNIKPITFRTLHLLLNTLIYGLVEMELITKQEAGKLVEGGPNSNSKEFFMKHFLKDYKLLTELLGGNDHHIWIYQVLNQLEKLKIYNRVLDTNNNLSKFEQVFEEIVILPLIQSVDTVTKDYKKFYGDNYQKQHDEDDVTNYVDEIKLNKVKYPLLEFFNYLNLPNFEEFANKYLLLIGNEGVGLPLLDLVLKKHQELANISSLPTIVDFTNYLMKKFNYKISRDYAISTPMTKELTEDETIKEMFKEFEDKWNKLRLQEVRVGCQRRDFQKIDFNNNLSLFLPNNSKDESGILIVGTMIALAKLQNEFLYTAKKASHPKKSMEEIKAEEKDNMDLIQTIKPDQVIDLSKDQILTDIVKNGYVHNFEYGKGREIIYDFEEIEAKLHQYANGKKILNDEKFSFMNYQFELYPEEASIFTDIRRKNPQEPFTQDARVKYSNYIKGFSKKDLLSYLGSLDYAFTYLRNINKKEDYTLEEFCKEAIQNDEHLNHYVTKKQPLCRIHIRHIVELYELVEEIIFDQAIQANIRPELLENIPQDESKGVIALFNHVTVESPSDLTYHKLKEPETLVKVFKKLILRVLQAQVNVENRLLEYFTREDMWGPDVNIDEIQGVELDNAIMLKHSYIILRSLEDRIARNNIREEPAVSDEARVPDQMEDDYRRINQKAAPKPQSKQMRRGKIFV